MLVRDAAAGGLIRVNRTFAEHLRYSADELSAKPLLDWIEPGDRAALEQALERGEGTVVARHRSESGDWVEFDWRVKSLPTGAVVFGTLHQPGHDLSWHPRRRSLAGTGTMGDILASMALIIESERPGMKCSVLLVDDDGLRVSVGAGPSLPDRYNAKVQGLAIGPGVGSCGTAAFWNERVVVEDIQKDPLWADLKELAADAGVAACWSHPITSKDGEVLGAAALYDPSPRAPTQQELDGLQTAARMFGLAIERGRAEERESAMEQKLSQAAKLEALGVLAGGLAHDFNNVLAAIMGNAELAMKRSGEDSVAYPMLREITKATRSAADLCKQMLAFAGRAELSMETVECNALIEEFGSLLRVALSKKATLEYVLSDGPLFVEGDRTQLGQVMMNLITNAAEAIGDGAGAITATTDVKHYDAEELLWLQSGEQLPEGDYVRIRVSDSGEGMDAETQTKIFDPFFTTKFTGRGLGLAAVQGVVNRHRGGLGLQSAPGEGTTFTIVLPRAEASKPSKQESGPSSQEGGRRRVMVVDDEEQVRTVAGWILEDAGFEVVMASDGREAVQLFERLGGAVDCVLLDLCMPELDGEETLRALREIESDVRVVLTSGFTEDEMLRRIEGAGANAVLQKPTPMALLVDKINEAMR